MSLAFAAVFALLVAALNIKAESTILLHNQGEWPTLGGKLKRIGTILVVIAIVFFVVGMVFHFCPNKYVDSNLWLSMAIILAVPGLLTAIKGFRLKTDKPEKLGRVLRIYALIMLIVGICLFVATFIRSIISV